MSDRTLPLGEWLPDLPDLENPGATGVENVIPRTRSSYSPMPSFATISSSALAAAPLGAFSAVDASGNPGSYVGTTAKLYRMTNATNPNFADSSGAVYTTPAGRAWSFTEGNGYVYATNGSNLIQRVATASASNFASLSSDAPVCKALCAVQPGFLLCGDIVDPVAGTWRQGVRWSALGDFSSFPAVGSDLAIANQSDWQNIQGPHGHFQAFAPDLAACNAAVFFEQGVFRMLYTGDDKIFDIQPVEKLRGTQSPRSVIQSGQVCYFLSYDGWYSFDGALARPFGTDRVNKFFLADADPNFISEVTGCADPLSGLCFWLYAGAGNNMGVPNRILVYNPSIDRFGLITGFSGYSPFIGRTFGATLDGIDALGYTLDNLPYSLDSSFLTGGKIVLAGFGTDFKYGSFSGANMAWSVDTTEAQLTPYRRSRIKSVRPLVQGGTASAAIASRDDLDDTVVFGASVAKNNVGICPVTSEGQYSRVRLSGAVGNNVKHIQGAQVDFSPTGKR